MKKIFVLLSSALLAMSLSAQDGEMQGVIITDSFPGVSFVWHEYNPLPLEMSAFDLKENGERVKINVERIKDTQEKKSFRRSVIILWEDMYCNGNMYEFSKQVLNNFIDNADIKEGWDNIYIASFNRHRNSDRTLKPITDGFIDNSSELHNDINAYRRSTETYSELSSQSDVYPAVLEALEIFKQRGEKENEVKGIFVLSAGRPLESSATNSAVEVQKQAKALHIPLYMFQYAVAHGKSTVLEGLGNDTYGKSVVFDSGNFAVNVNYAQKALQIAYRYLPSHYNGQDYRISFRSGQERGGKEVAMELRVKGRVYPVTLLTPKHTIGTWCRKYWYICLLICLVLIACGIGFFLYVKKQNEIHAADAAKIGKLNAEQAQTRQKIDEQNARIEQYKAEKGQVIIMAQKENHKQEMLDLMQKKNLFPRIQYADQDGNANVYEMHQTEIKIGRGQKMDIRLYNQSVSREHALIRFVGNGFEIEDLKSTNGIVVSGIPVQKTAPLHDHDVINLGTALLTFYL